MPELLWITNGRQVTIPLNGFSLH
jgi:hypothetical protein